MLVKSASVISFLVALAGFAFAAPPAIHVVGNKLQTDSGQAIILQGVNIPSLEWSNTGERVQESIREVAISWNVNVVRIPLSQDRWFGKSSDQKDGGLGYRAVVKEAITLASNKNLYVIADLHWSNAGEW